MIKKKYPMIITPPLPLYYANKNPYNMIGI